MPTDQKAGVTPAPTTRVHEIYIKAAPQAIWEAITSPEWNGKFGYRAPQIYELRPGGAYKAKSNAGMLAMGLPEVVIDGEIIECNFHQGAFHIPTGRVEAPPCMIPLRTYNVQVVGGKVCIETPTASD